MAKRLTPEQLQEKLDTINSILRQMLSSFAECK